MAKKITITIEDDEFELLELVGRCTDFYGDGYDDHKPANARSGDEIYRGLVKKIKTEFNKF